MPPNSRSTARASEVCGLLCPMQSAGDLDKTIFNIWEIAGISNWCLCAYVIGHIIFPTQSNHFEDRPWWQTTMASIEFWIPRHNVHGPIPDSEWGGEFLLKCLLNLRTREDFT